MTHIQRLQTYLLLGAFFTGTAIASPQPSPSSSPGPKPSIPTLPATPATETPATVTIKHPGKYKLVHHAVATDLPGYKMAVVDGREFAVTGDVVIPSVQSVYFLSHFKINRGETVLDIGTGSGIQAIFASDRASHVVATDISPLAVGVAKYNVRRNSRAQRIEVRESDLFSAIKDTEKFDVILFNIDYPFSKETQGLWKVHERFFSEVLKYLKPGGRIYYQSGLIENIQIVHQMIKKNEMTILSMRMDAALHEARVPIVYTIKRNADLYRPEE